MAARAGRSASRKQAGHLEADARGRRVLLLRAAFNEHVVGGLAEGARQAYLAAGGRPADLTELSVPGAFELPLAARVAGASGRFDAIVALGAVIRGDTDHYEHVARETAAGLQRAALDTGVPVAFGVLTTRTVAQARARARPGAQNKGAEAMRAALAMLPLLAALRPSQRGR